MLLVSAIFALLTFGFVLPCALDVAMTPRHHFDLPSKQTWLVVVVAFWAFGATAWLLVGRREARMRASWYDVTGSWMPQRAPGSTYLGGQALGSASPFGLARRGQAAMTPTRFIAPDDNPEFLVELERKIRERRGDA
ncbi:MAG TPA: hypothetical protein VNF47_22140 [Streptosporangiaceae bacterium]|nr:hypothetical protein [Streptosporangiaceae bacterium]